MNRVILPLLFVILLSQFSYSQSLGVRAGLNISKLHFDGRESEYLDNRFGLHLGAVAEFKFNKIFGLETGVIYSSKGSTEEEKYEYLGFTYSSKQEIILNYIEIPITGVIYYQLNSLELNFNAGPYLAYAINGTIHSENTSENMKEKSDEDIEFGSGENELNPLDVGFTFGIGTRYSSFKVGINYELGLANLSNDGPEAKLKNNNIMFTIGYYFDLSSL